MNNKNINTCLIVLPIHLNQDNSQTLKISELIESVRVLEKEKIEIKIATYRGNKPYLNFENEEKNRKWAEKHEDLLLNTINLDNIPINKFDGLIIPSYLYIYEELNNISDHNLCKVISQFHNANKAICTYGHGTYALAKCIEDNEENLPIWPFVGFNLTGFSLNNIMRENLFNTVPFIIEELVMIQGGNFVTSCEGNLSDETLVVCHRNVVTGMDYHSLELCLINLVKKLLN